jgi:hypothetical protein
MGYSFSKIIKVEDCDALLLKAEKIKNDLGFKLLNMKRQINSSRKRAVALPNEISSLQAKIQKLEMEISISPEGYNKRNALQLQSMKEIKLRAALQQLARSGPEAHVMKLANHDYASEYLIEVNILIDGLTRRRAELAA